MELAIKYYKFINDYASEKEINKSVAAERILLKGIEVMEQNNTNKIVEEIKKLIGGDIVIPEPIQEEEIKINLDLENENDKAIYNMFNSIPD